MEHKPKLHELLAVEGDLQRAASKLTKEVLKKFTDKQHLFRGHHKKWLMLSEEHVNDTPPDEQVDLASTVDAQLTYLFRYVVKYWDTVAAKEATNQHAVADLVVEGEVLASGLPATFLLGLESKLKEIRDLYEAIPTLDLGMQWDPDPTQVDGVFRSARVQERAKTAKVVMHKVLYQVTKEHPAQIEKWNETVTVGKSVQQDWSGMLSPADKADRISRIDTLMRAVKKARQRANSVEVATLEKVSKKLLDYING